MFLRRSNDNIKLSSHYVTKIKPNEYSGHELKMSIGGGMYHSMIYAGHCTRTGYPVVMDQDKGRSPGFRKIKHYEGKGLFWGDKPTHPAEKVWESGAREILEKHGLKNDYNFVFNNCQHYTSRHQHGASKSPQINQASLSVVQGLARQAIRQLFR